MPELERVPPEEAAQIDHIVQLTIQQLQRRYAGDAQVLRGVHPKAHGCVRAEFTVRPDLPESLRVGVFAEPGKRYDAWVRFSNATALVQPDSAVTAGTPPQHDSRGMAIKLMGVSGTSLVPVNGALTQDFLLINQPVFAFANVEDYEVVSRVLQENNDSAKAFFGERIRKGADGKPRMDDPVTLRALRTLGLIQRIGSDAVNGNTGAFAPPPASPVEARYFSAAAFQFGADRAAKFSAAPVAPQSDAKPDVADPNYLRTALVKRLMPCDSAAPVEFAFQVQVREAGELADRIDTEIEDTCVEWAEAQFPFVTVATLVIPPQNFDTPEARAHCEGLVFTPWHGVREHRPLGGINRLRRAVYEASAQFRHLPKEPAKL